MVAALMTATALVMVDTTLGEVDLVVVDLEVMVVVAAMAMTFMGVIVAMDHPMMMVADLLTEVVVVVKVAVVYLLAYPRDRSQPPKAKFTINAYPVYSNVPGFYAWDRRVTVIAKSHGFGPSWTLITTLHQDLMRQYTYRDYSTCL